jgi:hypothetical protein
MATGKQMLVAVHDAIKRRPELKELKLSVFDVYDLFKLRPGDLQDIDPAISIDRSELISSDLREHGLAELSEWLGVKLIKDKYQKNLIPGEGLRRTAGLWAGGNDDPDAMAEEIRRLRHPEAR